MVGNQIGVAMTAPAVCAVRPTADLRLRLRRALSSSSRSRLRYQRA